MIRNKEEKNLIFYFAIEILYLAFVYWSDKPTKLENIYLYGIIRPYRDKLVKMYAVESTMYSKCFKTVAVYNNELENGELSMAEEFETWNYYITKEHKLGYII